MSHVDEGLIHAWLEDQLPPDEAARVEQLVATDAAWGAAAAEARGLIAATARVIGALDSAPSAVGEIGTEWKARTARTKSSSHSWARKYWLRAAAAIVLVVGVSGIWFSGGDKATVSDALSESVRQQVPKPAEGAGSPLPAAASQASPVQQVRVPPSAPQVSAVDGRRDGARLGERRNALQSPLGSASPPSSAPTPPPTSPPAGARDEASGVRAATAGKDANDNRGAAANVAGGVGGGRGGRGGATGAAFEATNVSAQRSDVPRGDVVKSLAVVGDSVQRGCWVPLETPPPPSRQMNESARPDMMVLRFVPPVVTDLIVPAPAFARANAPLSTTQASALRAAPSFARIQNTTAKPKDDSTFVAEWYNPDGHRTQLVFRVRGDTLRGTTNAITGDIVTAGPILVAVRAQCPPQ